MGMMANHLADFDLDSGHPAARMQDDPLFSRLYARIAVLETELRHAKQQAEESSRGAKYLLSLQASARPAINDLAVDDLRKHVQQLRLENESLRDQVQFNGPRGDTRGPLPSSQNSSDFDQQPETDTPNDSQDSTLIDIDVDLLQGTLTSVLQPTAQHPRKHSAITISAPTHVASKPEPMPEIVSELKFEPKAMTAPDTSMLQGRLEWADETDMIQPVTRDRVPSKRLPPILIYQPEQKPVQVRNDNDLHVLQPPSANTGLSESHHNPSTHRERSIRNPTDPSTSRPAHARDENWIRWRPNDPKARVTHRVIITNLPDSTTANTLLSQVCGGLVVSCQILPTIPLTGSPSALVRFLDSESAIFFTAYAALNPLKFPDTSTRMNQSLSLHSSKSDLPTKIAHVSLIRTPTFPLTRRKLDGIKIYGHTRCLELRNFPIRVDTTQAMEDLMWFLRPYEGSELDFVESIDWKGEGELRISFTSVDAAVDAYGKFLGNELYRGCWAKFVRDPCERVAKVGVQRVEKEEMEMAEEGKKERVRKEAVNSDEIGVDLEEDEDQEIGENANMELQMTATAQPENVETVGENATMEIEIAGVDTALLSPISNEAVDVMMRGESGSDDTAMDTPPTESEAVDEHGTMDGFVHETEMPVPRNWNKARELQLELDYLRRAPGMR